MEGKLLECDNYTDLDIATITKIQQIMLNPYSDGQRHIRTTWKAEEITALRDCVY